MTFPAPAIYSSSSSSSTTTAAAAGTARDGQETF